MSIGKPNEDHPIIGGMATTLGERLKLAREELQLSRGEDLNGARYAREINIAPSSLHDLESGESNAPAAETLLAIRDSGISPDYVVRGKGPKLERRQRSQRGVQNTSFSILNDLDQDEQDALLGMAKAFLRKKPSGGSEDQSIR